MTQERSRDLPWSPAQIRGFEFDLTGVGRRGYQPEQVQAVMLSLARDAANQQQREADLRAEIERLRKWRKANGIDDVGYATPKAIAVVTDAQRVADAQIAAASQQAQAIVGNARAWAGSLLSQVRAQVDEVERQHQQALQSAGPDQIAAKAAEIEYLRSMARVTKAHLKAVLESITQDVERRLPDESELLNPQGHGAGSGSGYDPNSSLGLVGQMPVGSSMAAGVG